VSDDFGRLRMSTGGRVGYVDPETGRLFVARLQEASDGRLEVVELLVRSNGETLTTDDLRTIPLRTIEAQANQKLRSIIIKKMIATKLAPLEADVKRFLAPITAAEKEHDEPAVSPRLPKPNSQGRYPGDFYERVAAAYRSLVLTESNPATRLADVNKVRVSTVHRWIKEARRRGHLAAGRPGKAG
jgi:hypothetical protein